MYVKMLGDTTINLKIVVQRDFFSCYQCIFTTYKVRRQDEILGGFRRIIL